MFERFVEIMGKKLPTPSMDQFCGNFIKQQIKTISQILTQDLPSLLSPPNSSTSTQCSLDPLPDFISLLNSEISALQETEETPNTRVAMVIMDGFLDILNFIYDRDFDLGMQRMIGIWEHFFGPSKMSTRELPSFGEESLAGQVKFYKTECESNDADLRKSVTKMCDFLRSSSAFM